jgi:hypothetical protein
MGKQNTLVPLPITFTLLLYASYTQEREGEIFPDIRVKYSTGEHCYTCLTFQLKIYIGSWMKDEESESYEVTVLWPPLLF